MTDFDTELREILETPIKKRADNFPADITETALEEAWEKEKEHVYQEIIDAIKQAIEARLPEMLEYKKDGDKKVPHYSWNTCVKRTRERLGLEEE